MKQTNLLRLWKSSAFNAREDKASHNAKSRRGREGRNEDAGGNNEVDSRNCEGSPKAKPERADTLAAESAPSPKGFEHRDETAAPRQLSEYELLRLANMRRNELMMESLGLGNKLNKAKTVPKRKRRALTEASTRQPPRRRSARLAKTELSEGIVEVEQGYDEEEYVERERAPLSEGWELVDASLKTVYSMSVKGDMVAAGGKGGQVSVFGCRQASFRGCGGWIGGVAIIDESPRVLCCGNDGHLNLYDCSVKSAQGAPRQAASSRPHSSGIWSLATTNQLVATGAKDGAVSLHTICLQNQLRRFEDVSATAVKCVALDRQLLATADADGVCALYDVNSADARLRSINAHPTGGATSVALVPDHRLLTAGFDDVKLWDLRAGFLTPLATFHFPDTASVSSKLIRRPELLDSNTFALAGRNNACIGLYRLNAQSPPRILAMPSDDATALAAHPTRPILFVAQDSRSHAKIQRLELDDLLCCSTL